MKSDFPRISPEYLGKCLPSSGAETKDKMEVTVIFLSGFSTQEEVSSIQEALKKIE